MNAKIILAAAVLLVSGAARADGAAAKNELDFTRFLSGGFHQTLDNIGRNAL